MESSINKVNKNQILAVVLFAFYYILQLCLIGYAITYFQGKGISEHAGGIGVAIACAIATCLQPVLGNVADKALAFNFKRILYILSVISLILSVILSLLRTEITDIVLFCASIVIVLCMSPFINESCFYYNTKERPVSFGPARCGGSISYALVSYLLGYLMERNTPDIISYVVIIADVGIIVTLLILPRVSIKADSNNSDKDKADKNKESIIAFVAKYRIFFVFFFALILIFTFQNLFSANLINIVKKAGGDVETFGIVTAVAALAELPIMFFFSKLLKRFSSKKLIVFGAFCYILRSVLFLVAGSMIFVYAAQVLQAFTFAVIVPAMVYLSDETMSESDKNRGQSVMSMTISIGTILGFFLDGWLASYGVTLVMSVGLAITVAGALLSAIAYLLSSKMRRKQTP